jgi:hypothetical protein
MSNFSTSNIVETDFSILTADELEKKLDITYTQPYKHPTICKK